jgi:hypothetical protein
MEVEVNVKSEAASPPEVADKDQLKPEVARNKNNGGEIE